MLNGIDPVIVIQMKNKVAASAAASAIPTVSESSYIDLPVIPIYLSEKLTGIITDTEEKQVDIETDTETTVSGATPIVNQKGLSNVVRVVLHANRDSVGAVLLSALIDQIFEKLTSKEYSITYVHGATTVFNALINSYSVNANADNTLLTITIELSRSTVKPKAEASTGVPEVSGATIGVRPI